MLTPEQQKENDDVRKAIIDLLASFPKDTEQRRAHLRVCLKRELYSLCAMDGVNLKGERAEVDYLKD